MKRHFLFDAGTGEGGAATGGTPVPNQLTGEVTAEQIGAWKKSHPQGVYSVTSDSGRVAYFKNPTRNDLNCALSVAEQPLDHLVEFAKLTFLGGDESLIGDNMAATGVLNVIKSKFNGVPARIVDL